MPNAAGTPERSRTSRIAAVKPASAPASKVSATIRRPGFPRLSQERPLSAGAGVRWKVAVGRWRTACVVATGDGGVTPVVAVPLRRRVHRARGQRPDTARRCACGAGAPSATVRASHNACGACPSGALPATCPSTVKRERWAPIANQTPARTGTRRLPSVFGCAGLLRISETKPASLRAGEAPTAHPGTP
jgi:hypothetical protein